MTPTHEDCVKYLRLAYTSASLSPDPNTQVGSALVMPGIGVPILGRNDFARGVVPWPDRLESPTKYDFMHHAEQHVVTTAARRGMATLGSTLYCPYAACSGCARVLIDAGVKTLVRHQKAMLETPDRWIASIELADTMMIEAGMKIISFVGDLDATPIRLNGLRFVG